MNQNLIILPVFVQALLTLVILGVMGQRRRTALVSKATRIKDIALGQDAWPEDATKAANNYKNQFELPVLFYAVCAFALLTKSVDYLMLGLAVVFVATRILHAFVHVGANDVMSRARLFLAGAFVLLIMWILLFLRAVVPVI
jgi:hypothetical protein